LARHDDRDPKKKAPAFGNDALKAALQKVKQDVSAGKQAANVKADAERLAAQKRKTHAPPPAPGKSRPSIAADDDGDALFLALMDDVAPVKKPELKETPADTTSLRLSRVNEDAEALAQRSELVAAPEGLTLAASGAALHGHAPGLDPSVVDALKRGDFSITTTLDLGPLATRDAQAKTEQFILDSRRAGRRAVALKNVGAAGAKAVAGWLGSGRLARVVLAFVVAGTDVRVVLRR